jgi:hypothetical protein
MSDQIALPEYHCPECGAPRVNGMTCWEMLGMLLAWEYDDPELQAEHFLTVRPITCSIRPSLLRQRWLTCRRSLSSVSITALALPRFAAGSERPPQARHACSSRRQSEGPCCASGR